MEDLCAHIWHQTEGTNPAIVAERDMKVWKVQLLINFGSDLVITTRLTTLETRKYLQSPLKVLEQQSQILWFCCTLKTFGFKIKR